MKLLLVIDTLQSGGAQRLFVNLLNGLSQIYETKILIYNSTGKFFYSYNHNVKATIIKKTPRNGIKIRTLIKVWKELKKADIIISFMPSSSIYCLISRVIYNWDNILICKEVSINNKLENNLKKFIKNYFYILANHIVCNTYKQANYLSKFKLLSTKTSTIFNGCDSKKITFNKKSFNDSHNKIFIVVGRISYPKNGLRLLEALKLFYERNKFLPKIKWAGRIDDTRLENNDIYARMVSFLDNIAIVRNSFEFLGEVKDIYNLYENADGLILPSIYEGLPYVICESMLKGCPVLASNIADNELILGRNEEKGILCDPFSIISICKGIEKLVFLKEKETLKMTENARKYAEKNFSNAQMIDKYQTLINQLIKKHYEKKLFK